MAKRKLDEGSEADLRVTIERIWPDGQITIFIKSAAAGGRVTLLNDNDIVERGTGSTKRDKLV